MKMLAAEIKLDAGAAELINTLHRAGYPVYAVGGCVRDSLLGQAVHDWDLCTAALPGDVLSLFGENNCIPTGLKHGTVTVKRGGNLYEVTTFRTEGTYTDGRHPDKVWFVSDVKEDLARRDFTINAMAYCEEEGLIDPFGGQNDLEAGLVRAVGDANLRFAEDALRILRLYRFAARFGFAIDEDTDKAAQLLAERLQCVSVERICEELCKLLVAPKPGRYMKHKIIQAAVPELAVLTQQQFETIKQQLDTCPAGQEYLSVRAAALLCPLGEANAHAAAKRLRFSNAMVTEIDMLIKHSHLAAVGDKMLAARRLLGQLTLPVLIKLTMLCSALYPEGSEWYAGLCRHAQQLEQQGVCCRIAQLAVNGHDLMEIGVAKGPDLRCMLEALLEKVVTGEAPNEHSALLRAAQQMMVS